MQPHFIAATVIVYMLAAPASARQATPPPAAQQAGTGTPAAAKTAPAAVPLPSTAIPAGYFLAPTNYFEQVSKTAQAAIDTANANQQSLLDIVKIAGSIVGFIVAFGAFLGYSEIRHIRRLKKSFKASLKQSQEKLAAAENSLQDLQAMEGLLIDVHFLQNAYRTVAALHGSSSPKTAEAARIAVQEGEGFYQNGLALFKRRVTADGLPANGAQADETETTPAAGYGSKSGRNVERVMSYIAALVAIMALRADAIDAAVTWSRRSIQHNPRNIGDRAFNLACLLATRYSRPAPIGGRIADKQEALSILRHALKEGVITRSEIWDEDDFAGIRDELDAIAASGPPRENPSGVNQPAAQGAPAADTQPLKDGGEAGAVQPSSDGDAGTPPPRP